MCLVFAPLAAIVAAALTALFFKTQLKKASGSSVLVVLRSLLARMQNDNDRISNLSAAQLRIRLAEITACEQSIMVLPEEGGLRASWQARLYRMETMCRQLLQGAVLKEQEARARFRTYESPQLEVINSPKFRT